MSEIQVASRYAKSLIGLAEERKALEVVRGDIEFFLEVLDENSVLRAVLRNPIIGPDKKVAILEEIFGKRVDAMILSYFKIMVNKGRSEILHGAAKEFLNQYNIRKNIVQAAVTSAAPLSEENRKLAEKLVKDATKGDVILETKVDPNLIGGYILKIGDRQFDASISSSLRKLKKEFNVQAF